MTSSADQTQQNIIYLILQECIIPNTCEFVNKLWVTNKCTALCDTYWKHMSGSRCFYIKLKILYNHRATVGSVSPHIKCIHESMSLYKSFSV